MKEKLTEIFSELIQKKDQKGINQLSLSGIIRSKRGVNVYQSAVDSVEISDSVQIGIMVEKDQHWSTTLCEEPNLESIEYCIDQAIQTNPFVDPQPLMSLSKSVQKIESPKKNELNISTQELKELAITAEQKAYQLSDKIKNIPYTFFGAENIARILHHSNGVHFTENNSLFSGGISIASASDDKRPVNYTHFYYDQDNQGFDLEDFVEEAVDETLHRINPQKVNSGNWPVVFSPKMSAQLLMAFIPAFYGDALYKKVTKLENQENKKIASDIVSIIDDPTTGLVPHHYDGEGNIGFEKKLIDGGIFKNFLHSEFSANKTNQKNTANGGLSLGMLPMVHFSNLRWEGKLSTQLISSIDRGLLVKELHGASHSPISGDFSYGGLGYWIEDGKIKYPVADFTIAGNFFDLLQKIEMVGDNLQYFFPKSLGSIGGRALKISELSISG